MSDNSANGDERPPSDGDDPPETSGADVHSGRGLLLTFVEELISKTVASDFRLIARQTKSASSRPKHNGRGNVMGDFVVRRIMGRWAVTNNGIILSNADTSSNAIKVAVQTAAKSSNHGRKTRVLIEAERATEKVVIWDSTRDGFSKG